MPLQPQWVCPSPACLQHRSLELGPMLTCSAPQAGVLGTPLFLYESPSCQYVFSWRTSVACPLVSHFLAALFESVSVRLVAA